MNRGIIYVINHVLCLFTRFHPLFSDKKASKVLMNVFFLPPSLLPFNFYIFCVYAFYNYDSKARYLA